MNAGEKDNIVTLQSYYDPMLAHIVRTRLESNGIPCFVADEHAFGTVALFSQATGGIKVKVFERDLERCRQILAAEGDLHEEDHVEVNEIGDTYVECPYCGSTNVSHIAIGKRSDKLGSFLDSLSNLISPFHVEKHWHCNHCRQDFE